MNDAYRYDQQLGYVPDIPEPFWVRHWLFWTRPGCYVCRVKFRNRAQWETHYALNHIDALPTGTPGAEGEPTV